MLQVGNIDREGSEGFSSAETELEMRVGVGRHDSSLTNIIYDQVSSVSTLCRYSTVQYSTVQYRSAHCADTAAVLRAAASSGPWRDVIDDNKRLADMIINIIHSHPPPAAITKLPPSDTFIHLYIWLPAQVQVGEERLTETKK